ncbi:MAG: hypothetical protein HY401_04210 [Elusimicrobia bacterium]|nr:hypothetical protein [Elusimicrobiota bacterium]
MNKPFIPLKSLADGQRWVEKSINEVEESSTSIARGNARIGAVKAFVGLYRLAMDYAKLAIRGARVKELDGLVKLEFSPPSQETK